MVIRIYRLSIIYLAIRRKSNIIYYNLQKNQVFQDLPLCQQNCDRRFSQRQAMYAVLVRQTPVCRTMDMGEFESVWDGGRFRLRCLPTVLCGKRKLLFAIVCFCFSFEMRVFLLYFAPDEIWHFI